MAKTNSKMTGAELLAKAMEPVKLGYGAYKKALDASQQTPKMKKIRKDIEAGWRP